MIYVKYDPTHVPKKLLDVAARAQEELEAKPEAERKTFIEKKAHIWRSFAKHLAKMSYGKCWYSESKDPQSFFDVDHFRPKKAAKRANGSSDDGYPWLAFSLDNFRYSAGRSNRPNSDEDTEEAAGKGSWFPLLDGSPCANWDDRCVDQERPLLLDPKVRSDVALLDINPETGLAVASPTCLGQIKTLRVSRSIQLYGLNLPKLVNARKQVMREVEENLMNLLDTLGAGVDTPAVDRLQRQIRCATTVDAPYARAARAKLFALNAPMLCAQPEDGPCNN